MSKDRLTFIKGYVSGLEYMTRGTTAEIVEKGKSLKERIQTLKDEIESLEATDDVYE